MPFDAAVIADKVDFLTFPDLLKAHPVMEGGQRFVYLEASNQAVDYQGEIVLAAALAASADYYARFGNLDIDHITQIGARAGIPNYATFEVGRPVDVAVRDGRTFVKGIIFQGNAAIANQANMFWDSLTQLVPPQRWYPSVGGSVEERGSDIDPVTKERRVFIRKVRWTNIGFSKTPVNLTVATVSTIPIDIFAKSMVAGLGLDLTGAMRKTLEAGYGTDSAALTGGAALRTQSLDPEVQDYWEFRQRVAAAIRQRRLTVSSAEDLVRHARTELGLPVQRAVDWAERFLADLKGGRNPRSVQ